MKEEFNQELIDRINRIKIPKDLENYDPKIIPLGKSVIIKKIKAGERKTKSGLILAEKTSISGEVTARIIAFGPECYPYIRKGLLCTYNSYANMETFVNGETLLMVHQQDIYHIIVDEEIEIVIAPETEAQKRRREKVKNQDEVFERVKKKELNAEDKYEEALKARKKKIFAKTKS